jgi:hypothetical protein
LDFGFFIFFAGYFMTDSFYSIFESEYSMPDNYAIPCRFIRPKAPETTKLPKVYELGDGDLQMSEIALPSGPRELWDAAISNRINMQIAIEEMTRQRDQLNFYLNILEKTYERLSKPPSEASCQAVLRSQGGSPRKHPSCGLPDSS